MTEMSRKSKNRMKNWVVWDSPAILHQTRNTNMHTNHPYTQINSHINKTYTEVLSQGYEANCWLWTNINMGQSIPTCGTVESDCVFLPAFFFCENTGVHSTREASQRLPTVLPLFSSSVVEELMWCSGRGSLWGSEGPSLDWIISSGSFY